jgi:hypothetical protein
MPVADNSMSSGKQANRRVEITMVPLTSNGRIEKSAANLE